MAEKPRIQSRRSFLKEGTVAGLVAMAPPLRAAADMPRIKLGRHDVSRLVVGSNTMLGHSHLTRLVSQMMSEYFTVDRMADFLVHCTRLGINTFQSSYNEKLDRALRTFRDRGGQIQWVCLASRELLSERRALKKVIDDHRPIGVAHHGGPTDRHYRAGTMERVYEFCKMVRDLGVLAGISTHNPEILRYVEHQNWDFDFYMASCHYLTRTRDELKEKLGHVLVPNNQETYLEGDPPAMCAAVRQTRQPVLVYKILAAGRYCNSPEQVTARFRFAFENIKPTDAVIVGMYPQIEDQARINADLTRRYGAVS